MQSKKASFSHLTALVMCLSNAIDGVPNSPISIVSRPQTILMSSIQYYESEILSQYR